MGLLQHCPPGRFLLFATIGLALYVTGPAPLRRAWHRLLAMLPPMQVSTRAVHGLTHFRFLQGASSTAPHPHGVLRACQKERLSTPAKVIVCFEPALRWLTSRQECLRTRCRDRSLAERSISSKAWPGLLIMGRHKGRNSQRELPSNRLALLENGHLVLHPSRQVMFATVCLMPGSCAAVQGFHFQQLQQHP